MIQISQSSPSVSGFASSEVTDLTERTDATSNASQAGPEPGAQPAPSADPLAKFGALHGLHAQVQQLAYSSPGGSAGAGSTSGKTPAPAPAAQSRARTDADAPITASGLEGGKAWMERGNRLLQAHRYGEAIAAYQEGFRTYPDRAFILNEASALLDSGRFAEAVLAFERYLSDPAAPRADEARAALERARAQMGGREATITGVVESGRLAERGTQAYAAGRYEEALGAFEQAYELNPLADLEYNQAACLDKLGRRYAAVDRYDAYLAAAPNAADAAKVSARIAKLSAEADTAPITATGLGGGREWMTRGNRLLQAHRYDEAVAAFNEGFRTYPDSKFILNKATALLDGGRPAEAILAYEQYLSEPDAPRADEARTALERARAQMGGREATATGIAESGRLFEQGKAHYAAGRYADALQAFDRAYALNPGAELRYNQAACLDKLGLREIAASRYEAYLAESPGAADATKVRARITKLHAEARAAAQEAFDRGQAAYMEGRWNAAAGAFAEAYAQLPLPQFLYNQAAALDKAGDTSRAVRNYQLYLVMAPDAADAGKVRERIDELQKVSGNELIRP